MPKQKQKDNKNTKEYVIEQFNKDGIPLKVKKTNAYKNKHFSRILQTKKKDIKIQKNN